ncbi:MAG: TULIP family P47-like protein [Pseudomonadota bacterium]
MAPFNLVGFWNNHPVPNKLFVESISGDFMMSHVKTLNYPQTFRKTILPDVSKIQPSIFVPRHELAPEVLAAEANTQGWDTASAVRLTQVNAALTKSDVSPKSFSYEVSKDWTANGDFGPWTMSRGGSGSIVFLKVPITKASMTASSKKLDIVDGYVTIQVKLNYLPQPEGKDADKGVPNDLVTDFKERSPEDPAVVIQNINYGSATPPPDLQALFYFIIDLWFNDNLKLFNYVFAVVSLNQVSKSKQFDWLKPTYTSYAYYDGDKDTPSEDEGYFGVLNMTNGKAPSGLANQLPASAIPPDQGAALLIGNNLFLENMILPAVQGAFPDASASDFTITNDFSSVELKQPLDIDQVKVGLIWYQPTVTSMILQIVGDEIQTRMSVHVPISPGIDSYVTMETWNRLELVTKPDGTQTIGWVESREPIKNSYYTKSVGVIVTEVIVAIIGAVAVGVAGKLLTGIVRVVVIIIIGIIAGLAAATPTLIAETISKGAANALPPINVMLTEFTDPIEWPDATGFILSSVQLNGSLQLSGNFEIGTVS